MNSYRAIDARRGHAVAVDDGTSAARPLLSDREAQDADPNPADDEGLFRLIYPSLRRFAAVTAPLDLAPDDLLQDAVAHVLRRGSLIELDHPAAYLRRTMVNLAANHNRSRGRERRALARIGAAETTRPEYSSDLSELDRLSPEDRAAVYLADIERLPLSEVAAVLGIRAPAARARVSRARRRLREAVVTDVATAIEGGNQ